MHRAKNHDLDCDIRRWKNVLSFAWQYHTIGNFILLPNEGNLNCERGRKGDYFDLLLMDIAEYKKDIDFKHGVSAITENPYLLKISFEELKDIFFLDPYFDNDNNPINLYGLTREERGVRLLNQREKIYLELVDKYVEKSEEIIAYRGQKMVEELKKVL